MTLFQKLALLISSFLLVLICFVMFLNFKTANEFVQAQLYNKAQDTATALGLSLTTAARTNDTAQMEAMINSIFDSGYYEDVSLLTMDGKPLIKRHLDVKVMDVPVWFIDNVKISNSTDNKPVKELSGFLNVYPNPADRLCTIVFGKAVSNYELRIVDQLGKVCLTRKGDNSSIQNLSLDVSDLAAGVYIISVATADNSWLKKLIIQ